MTRPHTIVLLSAVTFLLAGCATGRDAGMYRQASRSPAISLRPAPSASVDAARRLVATLMSNETDVITSVETRRATLTSSLQELVAAAEERCRAAAAEFPDEKPDCPSNETVLGAWDRPTRIVVLDARRYADRVVVDLLYEWGAGTNYAGDSRIASQIWQLENRAWRLDDVYFYSGDYATAGHLRGDVARMSR